MHAAELSSKKVKGLLSRGERRTEGLSLNMHLPCLGGSTPTPDSRERMGLYRGLEKSVLAVTGRPGTKATSWFHRANPLKGSKIGTSEAGGLLSNQSKVDCPFLDCGGSRPEENISKTEGNERHMPILKEKVVRE